MRLSLPIFLVLLLTACGIPETNRAAPNLHQYRLHVADGTVTPAETAAVQEYYDAIWSGDDARFMAAKKVLAEIEGGGK